ncbi:MAG: class I SAM-dependent DNA methyltransferase [Acidimicrobiia bacterium]
METNIEAIQLPSESDRKLSQDEEWCVVTADGSRKRIRFHDYASIYEIPGLYEQLFYDRLKCSSPFRVSRLLADVMREHRLAPEDLRVLDLGAGNGMVGDELHALGVKTVVGVDIIPEARSAALRDRKGIYQEYLVTDMTDLPEDKARRLVSMHLNCLTTVATLGFGDIPPKAFATALSLVSTPGWLAFNIKEDFLYERDDSGFARLVRELSRSEVIRIEAYRRYRHRLAIDGRPIYYVAMIASKQKKSPLSSHEGADLPRLQ